MDEHELVCRVKALAVELGRTPSRDEFIKTCSVTRTQLERVGPYAVLLAMAGLTQSRMATNKGSLFLRDLPQVLDEYKPGLIVPQPSYKLTLVIPDVHFPFHSQRVLDEIYAWAHKEKPEIVIQIGDLYDMYCHSKFPRSQNVYNPKQEEDLGREGAEKMWLEIKKAVPNARCIQLRGNHEARAVKRTLESAQSLEHIVEKHVAGLMTFPGVESIHDSRQEVIIDGIEFIHGHYSGIGKHRDYALMNAVCGHVHVGGTSFKRFKGQTFWELNAGLAGDPESKALSYTSQRMTHWTPGFGVIWPWGPQFISL